MKESWVCRDYKRGDEHQILSLFSQVFQREMSPAFWQWRFIDNPFGKGIIKLLFDGNKLIGHYVVIPMDVQVQGRPLKAVFSMTTMTHPDYGGQGIFTYLAEEAYKSCQEKGFHFVYGFPNEMIYPIRIKKLAWKGFGKMTILERKLPTKAGKSSITTVIEQIERFDDTVNSLWAKVKQSYGVIIPRTAEYLNWRFVENPSVDYLKCLLSDDNGCVLGYVVLKVYAKENVIRGHIVDILSVADEEVVKLLLEYSYSYFLERGIYDISCWIPEGSFYNDILEEEGFNRKETETYFGIRIFNKEDTQYHGAKQFSEWFLTMGDSDVF